MTGDHERGGGDSVETAQRTTLRRWRRGSGPAPLLRWAVGSPGWAAAGIALGQTVFHVAVPAYWAVRLDDNWAWLVTALSLALGTVALRRAWRPHVESWGEVVAAWDRWRAADYQPDLGASRYDPHEIRLSGWRLRGGPSAGARRIGADATRTATVLVGVVLVPLLGVWAVVLVQVGIVFAAIVLANVVLVAALSWFLVRRWAEDVGAALRQWDLHEPDVPR